MQYVTIFLYFERTLRFLHYIFELEK